MNIYGVLVNGVHHDVSNSEKGAKQYASKNGFDVVTIRYNGGYVAREFSIKENGKWVKLNSSHKRYENI